ncbi:MAG: DUF4417 domain-containing protein [Spirochaetales bacterium]|nr:DUF4417 domain-containing protein [Spirochaetales bacterium]
MAKNKPISLDDGFRPDLVENAIFDGIFEIPHLEQVSNFSTPTKVIPFSLRNRTSDFSELVVFFEKDRMFRELLQKPEDYTEDLRRFAGGITTPDCSLYRDSPLSVQIANTYKNRALGYFYQRQGLTVIPTVRWGDERSYSKTVFPEAFSFLGIPKKSVVAIGTYGCIKGKENKFYFEEGLEAMLKTLMPHTVIVYGRMPDNVFEQYSKETKFIHFLDWTSIVKRQGEGHNGSR